MYGRLEYIAKDIDKAYGFLSLIHMPPNDQILFPRTLRLLLQSWQLKGILCCCYFINIIAKPLFLYTKNYIVNTIIFYLKISMMYLNFE